MSTRWERLDESELAVPGRWRLVPALATLKDWPGLLQRVLGKRFAFVRLSDGRRLLGIRLPRGVASYGQDILLAEQFHRSSAWILALEDCLEEPRQGLFPALAPGPVRLGWDERDWPELFWGELRLGCALSPLSRDWAWAWVQTCGPVILRIFLQEQPRSAIEGWLHGLAPIFDEEGTIWVKHPQTGLYHSRIWDDSRLSCADNYLVWMPRHRFPSEQQAYYDHVALHRLADGELGELSFDLFDGDYYRYVASGHSRESFRRYLEGKGKAGRSHSWNRFREIPPIDARANSEDECARRIGESLGWAGLGLESLCARLREHPTKQMPRHIHVEVLEQVFSEAARHRIVSAQPRVQWWWTA